MNNYPILYSFRRCPYAMRARLMIALSGQKVQLREVVLRDRPTALRKASPKATVPVLVLDTDHVIDQSIDIMTHFQQWVEPNDCLPFRDDALIEDNDGEFKKYLDKYKYHDRHPEQTKEYYREKGEDFLKKLESLLAKNQYLAGETISFTDLAILPFIRQFAHVDTDWFDSSEYTNVQRWLQEFKDSALFNQVMKKYDQWHEGDEPIVFPE